MFSNGEIVSMVILIIIGIIIFMYSLDRICKCIEKCRSMKIVGKYFDKNRISDFDEEEKVAKEINDLIRKGLGK